MFVAAVHFFNMAIVLEHDVNVVANTIALER
jgi:hypothetical protein